MTALAASQMQVVALGKAATVTTDADGQATTIVLTLPINDIRGDGGTQSRSSLSEATVEEYADVVRAGGAMPPVVVFDDGAEIWLGDGFHRFHAHRAAGVAEILCEVRFGTRRDAILFSVGANASHGLRRTNEDKRRAVMTLLNDPEWCAWTQARIAETCGVSREFVSRVSTAQSPSCIRSQDTVRVVERNGKTYELNTANIGKARSAHAGAEGEPVTAETSMDADFTPVVERGGSAPPGQIVHDDDAADLVQMAEELQRENEAYQRQIKSLEADDKNAELVRLNTYADQLNGRLQGEIITRNEAQKMVKHYADLLAKIRKALSVESNKDILSALERK